MTLIHACCADCLLKLVEQLPNKDASIYFYNPNIYPREEYLARLNAVKKVNQELKLKLIVPAYRPQEYFSNFSRENNDKPSSFSHENFKIIDKNSRCPQCWYLRLRKTFEYAKENDFDQVTSTLLSSCYQDQDKIKKIADKLSKDFEIKFYFPEKIDHHKKTCGFYKQNFCGCLYSLIEKSREKYNL
jgi:predicted adenine nucleotide alpha hydrolase (AANH) superfamily ATPase